MDVWSWSSPIGLGLFMVMAATVILLLCWAINILSADFRMMPNSGDQTKTVASRLGRGRRRR